MALNEQGYKELAQMGYLGLGGKGGRAAVTLTVKGLPLFSTRFFSKVCDLKQVTNGITCSKYNQNCSCVAT